MTFLCSFCQLVLPYDDVVLRAKITQRSPYHVKGPLDHRVEFELSRLLEKEQMLQAKLGV
jgi:hypothetical protein